MKTHLKDGSIKIIPYSKADFSATKDIVETVSLHIDKKKRRQEEAGNPELAKQRKMEEDKLKKPSKNVIYIEGLGSLSPYSINYERRFFTKWKDIFSVRVGISKTTRVTEYPAIIFSWGPVRPYSSYKKTPVLVSLNLSFGEKKHHFEFGVGAVYNSISDSWKEDPNAKPYTSYTTLSVLVAYRYQKPFRSMFLRAELSTFTDKYGELSLWAVQTIPMPVIALGYNF